jgi:hypothetical protein
MSLIAGELEINLTNNPAYDSYHPWFPGGAGGID